MLGSTQRPSMSTLLAEGHARQMSDSDSPDETVCCQYQPLIGRRHRWTLCVGARN